MVATPFVERRRPIQNRLLRALSAEEYGRLAPHLKPVQLTRGQVLHRANLSVDHVYFPTRGVCGFVAVTERGHGVDVGPVGCEGVTGICKLAVPPASMQLLVQIGPAEAQRLAVERFEDEMDRHGLLRQLVTGYYHAFFSEVVESVACNRLHSTRQRYCRRLLTLADRLGSDTFAVTHDLMASMLGIQRPAVSGMALSLKHTGAIDYRRGEVTILDRAAVESNACECYRAAYARIAHLLPPRPTVRQG